MIIRSLLLGSAAAMVAASSAQAADAIVVEPEPVEYVRVCDAYGTGYFFIPGTETCIRFSGFVRSAYSKQYNDTVTRTVTGGPAPITAEDPTQAQVDAVLAAAAPAEVSSSLAAWEYRARINIDTQNDTDWGVLRGQMRFQGTGNEGSQAAVDVALISLAGFRAGYGSSVWGANHNFGGVAAEGAEYNMDGYGTHPDAMVFDYTFAAEGFSVTIGVEDPSGDTDFDGAAGSGTDANFHAGVNYEGDWGNVGFIAMRDGDAIEYNATSTAATVAAASRGEWAYKASLYLDLSEFMPGGGLWGWYMYDGDAATEYLGEGNNASYHWGVAFQTNLTDEVVVWANYWQADGGWTPVALDNTSFLEEGDSDQWAVGLNWTPAALPGFEIRTAYNQGSRDRRVTQGTAASAAGANPFNFATAPTIVDTEYSSWEIVLKRNF